jgi:hypothetical protein
MVTVADFCSLDDHCRRIRMSDCSIEPLDCFLTNIRRQFVHERGLMNSIYIWTANVGSNLGVVAAGYITGYVRPPAISSWLVR